MLQEAALKPVQVAMPGPKGADFLAQLDDAKLLEVLLQAFYDRQQIEALPSIISAVSAGNTAVLKPLLRLTLDQYSIDGVSLGNYLSVECHDEFPFNSREAVVRGSARTPLFRKFALATLPLAACPSWPAGAAAAQERLPVRIPVPTLILAGVLDPVTPPPPPNFAKKWLPNSFAVNFADAGHGVLAADACASRLTERFLADTRHRPIHGCAAAYAAPRFKATPTP